MKEREIFYKNALFQKKISKNVITVTPFIEVYQKRHNSALRLGRKSYGKRVTKEWNSLIARRDRAEIALDRAVHLIWFWSPFQNELS